MQDFDDDQQHLPLTADDAFELAVETDGDVAARVSSVAAHNKGIGPQGFESAGSRAGSPSETIVIPLSNKGAVLGFAREFETTFPEPVRRAGIVTSFLPPSLLFLAISL